MQDDILDSNFFDKEPYDWTKVNSSDMIEIKTYPFEQQAHMAKALLDSEGIPNFLKNANIVSVYSGLSAGLGGIGLMILRKDVERVLDALAQDEEHIEISDEMLTEAMLTDMELEAHEIEQEVEKHFNLNSFLLLIGGIVGIAFLLWYLTVFFFS